MTKPSGTSAYKRTIGLNDRQTADFHHDDPSTVRGDAAYQPLITSAILTTTAFRMRDDDALIEALRLLLRAVKPFESNDLQVPDQPEQ